MRPDKEKENDECDWEGEEHGDGELLGELCGCGQRQREGQGGARAHDSVREGVSDTYNQRMER